MPLTVSKPELLVDGEDHLFRQAVHDALGFSARLQEIRNRLGEVIGLSGPAYSILIAIEHLGQEGEVGVSKVGDHLHLSGAFVTIEVNKLVKSGLVDKVPHLEDGRRVVLTVTNKARALLDELASTQCPVNDTIFDGLSKGFLNPVISDTFPLAEAASAHREVIEGKSQGKIVLVP